MITLVPDYYYKFHCIANNCKHSCCIGWEIDIDDKTYRKYIEYKGPLKHALKECICHGETPYFKLDEKKRCPFLNDNNLCDIYCEMGDESLCQICTDHPRFRNFYSSITEVGLGICCEEACRIIMKHDNSFKTIVYDSDENDVELTDEEAAFFKIRDKIISILNNRSQNIEERFLCIWDLFSVNVEIPDLKSIFTDLEYMDHNISELITYPACVNESYLEQLAVYFIFRHMTGALDDGLFVERAVFAYIGVKAVSAMCKSDSIEEFCENARIFSSEIEYSEDNIDEILFRIGDLIEISI